MTDFQLDTTGFVDGDPHFSIDGHLYDGAAWSDLSPFTQGYVEALIRDRYLRDKIGGAVAVCRTPDLDVKPYAFSDLAPEALARIITDCEVCFSGWVQHPNNAAVRKDDRTEGGRFWSFRQAGEMTQFPPLPVQLGDDGKVRFSQAEGAA